LKDAHIEGLEKMGCVGRVAEEMDFVLTAETDKLEGVPSLMPIGEEENVVIGILSHRLDLTKSDDGNR